MNSKMTEKDARAALRFLTESQWCAVRTIFDLEFAPEPVNLPERLVDLGLRGASWNGWIAWHPAEQNSAPVDPVAISKAAVDRYNAYPGLYKAAKNVLYEVRRCGPVRDYEEAAMRLEAELAKGPKP